MKASETGNGLFLLKMVLAAIYLAVCVVAERSHIDGLTPFMFGISISAVVVLPLAVCALLYARWWRYADEFQKALEYRAMSMAGLSGLLYMVILKLATYFDPSLTSFSSFGVIGYILMYWVGASRRLNVVALQP